MSAKVIFSWTPAEPQSGKSDLISYTPATFVDWLTPVLKNYLCTFWKSSIESLRSQLALKIVMVGQPDWNISKVLNIVRSPLVMTTKIMQFSRLDISVQFSFLPDIVPNLIMPWYLSIDSGGLSKDLDVKYLSCFSLRLAILLILLWYLEVEELFASPFEQEATSREISSFSGSSILENVKWYSAYRTFLSGDAFIVSHPLSPKGFSMTVLYFLWVFHVVAVMSSHLYWQSFHTSWYIYYPCSEILYYNYNEWCYWRDHW